VKEHEQTEKGMSRRNFVKGLAAGAAIGYFATSGLSSTLLKRQFVKHPAVGAHDIGELQSLKITCISETSWFNGTILLDDIMRAGGIPANQYTIDWTTSGVEEGFNGDNSGGYSALIETEGLDGERHTFLLDVGWSVPWNERRFKDENLIKSLENGEIEFAFISHEHFDHYWGLPFITKHNPELPMYIPSTFYPEGYDLMEKAGFRGELVEHEPGQIYNLFPGCAAVTFDVPILVRVRGEQVLYFNIKDKGLVTVTGCCHPGIITLSEFARQTFAGGEKIYGVYGGLHVSPFEAWDPSFDDLVFALPGYGIERIGANHCTGLVTVQRMVETGLPVVRGTAQHKSASDLYLGNGDTITF